MIAPTPNGDRPRKNERPPPSAGTPNTIMSPTPEPTRGELQSKHGRPRTQPRHTTPRSRTPTPNRPNLPQPLLTTPPGQVSNHAPGAGPGPIGVIQMSPIRSQTRGRARCDCDRRRRVPRIDVLATRPMQHAEGIRLELARTSGQRPDGARAHQTATASLAWLSRSTSLPHSAAKRSDASRSPTADPCENLLITRSHGRARVCRGPRVPPQLERGPTNPIPPKFGT
jgi:hypothetical protein